MKKPEKTPGRYYYPGREFSQADNLSLPCRLRLLPSGTVYGFIDNGMRRLDSIKGKLGVSVSVPDGHDGFREVLLCNDCTVLVGDEIATGRKKEPVSILKQNSAALEAQGAPA